MKSAPRPAAPQPMLATLGRIPASSEGYALELKHDGQRNTVCATPHGVWLYSRNGADVTQTFPEVSAALTEALPISRRRIILDEHWPNWTTSPEPERRCSPISEQ